MLLITIGNWNSCLHFRGLLFYKNPCLSFSVCVYLCVYLYVCACMPVHMITLSFVMGSISELVFAGVARVVGL